MLNVRKEFEFCDIVSCFYDMIKWIIDFFLDLCVFLMFGGD